MFSNAKRLRTRTPNPGIDRREYIQLLVDEFYETTNLEAQEQTTANLANFAYDPINYSYLKLANAIDLFLELLTSTNSRLILHGIAGICNICLDAEANLKIIQSNGIQLISNLLYRNVAQSPNDESSPDIIINAITTLIYLINANTRSAICSKPTIQRIRHFADSANNVRIQNLAKLFLEDFCTVEKIVINE